MRTFILTFALLFSCSLVSAAIVDIGGYYEPVTKTFSGANQASGTIVWIPASGKRIVLMGAMASALAGINTTINIGTGIGSDGNGSFVDVISCVNVASGPITVGNGVPIWKGTTNGTLAVTTNESIKATLTLWGYEVQ